MMQNIKYIVISSTIFLGTLLSSNQGYARTCDVAINDIDTKLVPKILVSGDREFGGNGPDIWSNVKIKTGEGGRKLYADVFFRAKETKSDWSETKETFSNLLVWEAPSGQRITKILSDDYSETQFKSQKAGFQILGPTRDWIPVIDIVVQLARAISGDSGEDSSGDSGSGESSSDASGGIIGELCRELGEPDVERCKEKFETYLMFLNRENHVHVVPPTPGKGALVASFFIVGDTGGDDISDDNNPKDDTRIDKIAFNKVRLELDGASSCPPIPPERARDDDVGRSSGALTSSGTASSCAAQVQGKISWDYNGNKQWSQNNINRLCDRAENSPEPARCFNKVMHGGINWGGGTQWQWKNAIDLCEGSTNANRTTRCFQREIKKGKAWQAVIQTCGG